MAWIAFYPRTGEAALESSAWMAEATVRSLGEAVEVTGLHANRGLLEQALASTNVEGAAFFCHGSEHRLIGGDGTAALDEKNVHLLRGKWGHAVACHSGVALPALAAAAGATCFVGYDRRLIVEWDPAELPEELLAILSRLVSETTRNIRIGIHSRAELQRCASGILDELRWWIHQHGTDLPSLWFEATAQQLVERMVVA